VFKFFRCVDQKSLKQCFVSGGDGVEKAPYLPRVWWLGFFVVELEIVMGNIPENLG